MDNLIKNIFSEEKIEYFSAIPIEACRLRRPDIIERNGVLSSEIKTAIMFLVPYYVNDKKDGIISLYARSKDYHYFCDNLFSTLTANLQAAYGGKFIGFADKSPIEETDAASKAGLGKIGDSYMIINEKYGTFVFIGEILSTLPPETFGEIKSEYLPSYCNHCGECKKACPMVRENMPCLSAVTQKKGELTKEEENYIKKYGYAWGCDICSLSCPLVKKALSMGAETPINFFKEERISNPSSKEINAMQDEEFICRAFSWRGKDTIIRNLLLFENKS